MHNDAHADISEKMQDAILKAAFEEAVKQEAASCPGKAELDQMYPRSEIFDRKIGKLITKAERSQKRRPTIQVFTSIAASVAILLGVGNLVYMTTAGQRGPVDNPSIVSIANPLDARVLLEPVAFTSIDINGQEVFLIESAEDGGLHVIKWEREGETFEISANIEIEALFAIVESILDR
ncbi:MAG: DUF4367 domain-containing protein [Clostridiales bacterium]|nr:DUF4367 domain-containing protein [Clostridiales bacterium]